MIRSLRILSTVCVSASVIAGGFAAASSPTTLVASTPVFETTSSGLITFSGEDEAIRVAVVFTKQDDAVVETSVRFVDANGVVLKQQRGDLRDGEPVVAELTRRDVGERTNLLVRVEVIHKLPGVRDSRYPIVATLQPISLDGFGRFVVDLGDGVCGCPTCGAPIQNGAHADCGTTFPSDM